MLIKWLNNELHLSKEIKEISEDFKNGYLFAELLYKTKQIQSLAQFKNSNNKKDIIRNFSLLNQTLLDMGIVLNEKDRNEIINGGIYTSKVYLLKIRQVLDKKCINLEQLKFKYSNDLQNLYNRMKYKNENEKYLYKLKIRLENEKNNIRLNVDDTKAKTEAGEDPQLMLDKKYSIGGPIYKQLKKKYSHLELSDFELEILLTDMKEEETKINYLKEKVQKTEKKREKQCISKEKKEIKNWNSSIKAIKQSQENLLKESWEPVIRYQKKSFNYFKKNAKINEKITKSFENNLNFFMPEKKEVEDYEENNEEDLKRSMELKNEMYMRQIKEKLEQKIKSKKDKERRERKRLKEEREMYERMNTEKNMNEMIKSMEMSLNQKKIISPKGDELIAKTEKMMSKVPEEERKRIEYLDRLINKEINKENKKDELNNELSPIKLSKVNMNVTKLFRISKIKEDTEDNEENEVNENENENTEKEKEIEEKTKEIVNAEKSSYSKLTDNDYGLNLINETFKIHNKDININDRIKLFKTRLLDNGDSDKFKNLPKLTDISITEEDDNNKKQKSQSNVLEKSTNNNTNSNIFDKESLYEEMNKLNYENFKKESNERKIKKEKKKNLIKPIINKIIETAEYISIYQDNKGVQLLDNAKWDEIMDKFINWEDIFDNEEEEVANQDEASEYLYNYGDKLTNIDNLILFDYVNYLKIFNDLIIPTPLRGKQYKYYEIYDEVYNSLNNDVDIKEYEPNEEEFENLGLPKSPNIANYKFYDIICSVINYKYNQLQINNPISVNSNDNFDQKGKFYYLPIKMSITGYPLSGKKTQCSLIIEKYPNIKLFDPEELFNNKLEEYNELKEPVEKSTKSKNLKPNQLEQLIKEREEKLKQFEPILNIIQPYLDFNEKNSTKTLNLQNTNYKEDLITDIYIDLLLYELDKAYPDDKESKNKLIEELNEKYKQYISINDQIKEIKKNEEESKKENEDKGNKNKKAVNNFAKDLELLNKTLDSIIPSLFVGFIFINFPKNVQQAKRLENKITGYISEFEKPKDFVEEKIFSYHNIIDLNIRQKKSEGSKISMFDIFINLNITSEEVDHRYKNAKYDPSTKKIYNMEENPPSDKKIIEKLLPGVPNFDKEKLKEEKEIYEKSIYELNNFYKIMTNGKSKIYKNVDQIDKKYSKIINEEIENSMNEIIFQNYFKNIELIINKNKIEIEKSKNDIEENKNDLENNEKENKEKESQEKEENAESKDKNPINENIDSKKEENDSINNSDKRLAYLNTKEIKMSIYNFPEEISNQFEDYANTYKNILLNFLHFIIRQREHITLYLTQIQNEYVEFLNRKTEKTNIAEIYINKYNTLLNKHPDYLNNPKIYNNLMEDIEDTGKSLWLNIQKKKNEDVKYLQELKEIGKLDKELEKFWEFILIVIEAEAKKYLFTCEIIIKYYLNQTGLLGNILGIFENNLKVNQLNEFLFKINHLKYIFKGIDVPENLFGINKSDEPEEERIEINNDNKKENEIILEDENEIENNDKNNKNEKNEEEKQNEENKKNITKTELNETQKSKVVKEKTIEEKLDILFMNSLKLIVRQDLLMKKYKEKIKNFNPSEKEIKSSSINKLLNSSISSKSSKRKSKLNKVSKTGFILYIEEFSNQIKIEKQKYKYRLMFLKSFFLKYYNMIIECFNNTYNAMDDWIIMSVRSQNNSLNEFVSYLKKILNKSNRMASLEDFEFDNFDIYKRYKVDVSSIFEKMNLNSIVNLNTKNKNQINKSEKNKKEIKKSEKNNELENNNEINKNEIILINENDIPYADKYVYNINDLMNIYNYLKNFGTEGCEHLVKYEYVQEILLHLYFSKKKYGDLSNINNINNNSENEGNGIEMNNNSSENNNSSINLFKSSSSNNIRIIEENNGIPKMIYFLSNMHYINFLNKFSEYDNKYININELFTSLIIIGSELITSEKFIELIKEQIPNAKNIRHTLLSQEEFLKLNFWFENDKYLNMYADEKESESFKGKETKIEKIKNSIFEINAEEEKIDLNKILELLDIYNGKKEKKEILEENKIEEKKEEIKIEEKEKEDKDKINMEDKEDTNENKKEEEEGVKEIKEDKIGVEENEEKEEEDENQSDKVSLKNEENTNQNESDILKMTKEKKTKKKKDEITNNIFNAVFFN